MDLVKLEKKLPLRAYPEEDLNRVLLMDFLPWISGLLSLTDEVSAERLELTLPVIRKQCIGMGFHEIKKMFEMYADGEMDIKPLANYFDRIIFGKIVNEYRSRKPKVIKTIKPMYISKEEKEHIMKKAIDQGRSDWLENGILELATSRYDWLDEHNIFQKVFKLTETNWEKVKKRRYLTVREQLRGELEQTKAKSYMAKVKIKELLKSIETSRNGKVIAECKRSLLIDYYDQSRIPEVDQPESDMIGKEPFIEL